MIYVDEMMVTKSTIPTHEWSRKYQKEFLEALRQFGGQRKAGKAPRGVVERELRK